MLLVLRLKLRLRLRRLVLAVTGAVRSSKVLLTDCPSMRWLNPLLNCGGLFQSHFAHLFTFHYPPKPFKPLYAFSKMIFKRDQLSRGRWLGVNVKGRFRDLPTSSQNRKAKRYGNIIVIYTNTPFISRNICNLYVYLVKCNLMVSLYFLFSLNYFIMNN